MPARRARSRSKRCKRQLGTKTANPSCVAVESTPMKTTVRIIIVAAIIYALTLAIGITRADAKSVALPCKQYHALMRKHGLPVKVFAPIMYRESRCEPRAIGWNYHRGKTHRDCRLSPARTYRKCKAVKSFDSGLLQINSTWRTVTKETCNSTDVFVLLQPNCNLAVAARLYANGKGLSNWRATSGDNLTDK